MLPNLQMGKILAIGDCNTLGVADCSGNSYPERLGKLLGMEVDNCACTMATTREGVLLLKKYLTDDVCYLFIQFGLVDSYKTFKYSPYILYFPDNFFRKQVRSLVKKYKKICRNTGLNKRIGETNVVGIEEYEQNLQFMVSQAQSAKVFLLDTVPHKHQERNPEIVRYNEILSKIAKSASNCVKIELYEHFYNNLSCYYYDETHCNGRGYDHIVQQIMPHIPPVRP